MKRLQQDDSTSARSSGKITPTVATWAVSLAILFGASILASSLGLFKPAFEVRAQAQRTEVIAIHAIGDPTAPVSARAGAASTSVQ